MENEKVNQENVSKKAAVQFEYNPTIRVSVPIKGAASIYDVEEHARKLVLEKLRACTKEDIIDWLLDNEKQSKLLRVLLDV